MLRSLIHKGLVALTLAMTLASGAFAQAPVSQQFARPTAGPSNGAIEGLAAARARRRTTVQSGKEIQCRMVYRAASDIHSLRIFIENLTVGNSTPPEQSTGTNLREFYAVEFPANHVTPVTWASADHADIVDGDLKGSDRTKGDLAIPAGSDFWLDSFETSTNGGGYLYVSGLNAARGEKCQDGNTGTLTNNYLSPASITGNQNRSTPVIAIVSPDARNPSVIGLADSRGGLGSTASYLETATTAGPGYIGEIFTNFSDETIPFLNLVRPGIKAQEFDTYVVKEKALLGFASDYVIEYGINDFTAGRLATQVKADNEHIIAEVLAVQSRAKVMVTTVAPKATSASGAYIGSGDQSPAGGSSERVVYNNSYVRAQAIAGQNNGVGEVAWSLEAAHDSSTWRLHPLYRQVTNAATTISSNVLSLADTSQTSFTSNDIGLGVFIVGATGAVVPAIKSITDSTHAVLDGNATATLSGATAHIGECTIDGTHEQPACITLIGTTPAFSTGEFVFPDTKPRPFSFTPVANVAPSSTQTSNSQTIIGLGAASPITIANGTYSLNGGSFVSTPGFVLNTDSIAVRGVASASFSTPLNVTPTIGGVAVNYTITTQSPFAFVDVLHGALSTSYTSNTFIVAAGGSMSVSGGTYSLNGGACTGTTTVSVSIGDTVAVCGTTSASVSTHTAVTLTIGSDSDTFDETTVANSEASAFILRITADPGDTRRGLMDTFVSGMKNGATCSCNIWNKMDSIKIYAANDNQSALLNWKSTSFNSTNSGATFTTDRGYTGNGTSTFLDEGMADNDGTGNWLQNSGYLAVYVNSQGASSSAVIGTFTSAAASTDTRIIPLAAGSFTVKLHGTGISSTAAADALGLSAVERSASGALLKYRNGAVSGGNQGTASNATVSAHIFTLKANGTFSDDRVAAAFIGGTLAANENADVYSALLPLLTAIGAN